MGLYRGRVQRQVTSAGVAQANTHATDLLPTVAHFVRGADPTGNAWCVLVEAEEPGAAIDLVATMAQDEFSKLAQVVDEEVTRDMRTKAGLVHT